VISGSAPRQSASRIVGTLCHVWCRLRPRAQRGTARWGAGRPSWKFTHTRENQAPKGMGTLVMRGIGQGACAGCCGIVTSAQDGAGGAQEKAAGAPRRPKWVCCSVVCTRVPSWHRAAAAYAIIGSLESREMQKVARLSWGRKCRAASWAFSWHARQLCCAAAWPPRVRCVDLD
jgi:hypothetical protein